VSMSGSGVAKADAVPGDGTRCNRGWRTPRARRAVYTASALVLLLVLSASWSLASVHASPAEDCNQVRDLQRQLRGCTIYIKRGRGSRENLATAYLNRANIFAKRRKYKRAFPDYAAAISRDPDNTLAFYNRGNAYFDTRRYARAIADYSRAIALDRGLALAYFNRGLARERRGERRAAAADYRRTLALDPKATVARRRLQRLQSR
jgi:tetratricopeptide (TPR) repeat protein